MNIRAQGRLLAKYELITPNSLREGAIQRSISPRCSFRRDLDQTADEPQILTQLQMYDLLIAQVQALTLLIQSGG